jgi:glucose-6-phosphate 1-dehydrogenase
MIDPCTFVIFGATGNLAANKLLPALYHLEEAQRLPEAMRILCFGRREYGDDAWRAEVEATLIPRARHGLKPEVMQRFAQRVHYFQGDLGDVESYHRLRRVLSEGTHFPDNVVFYMAIRPAEFGMVGELLAQSGLNTEDSGGGRGVVVKPGGF